MSSILEALRELEGGDGPTTTDAGPWTEGPGPLRRALPIIALALVGAAAGAGAFLWSRRAPAPEPAAVATALPPAAPAVPPPAALLDAEPPRARLTPKTPAAAPTPLERPAARVAARTEPAAPRPAVARAATPSRQRGPRPAGEPRVDLFGIGYSNVETQRVVSLRVNGGPLTTLHEGESIDGIEVQLILPRSIYVRHAGQIFAVDAGG